MDGVGEGRYTQTASAIIGWCEPGCVLYKGRLCWLGIIITTEDLTTFSGFRRS